MLLLTNVFPTAALTGQRGRCCEQIVDRNGQVVVGVHQPHRGRDDAVPVRVGIVRKGETVLVLKSKETRHGIRARRIHADFAVMIDRHEREGGIDCPVGNDDVELMDGVDRLPVWAGCATERIDTQRQARIAYCSDVNDVPQVIDVRAERDRRGASSLP